MESKEVEDLTLAQQKQFDLVSFRVSWSQAVLFGCYEVRFLLNILCDSSSSLGRFLNIHYTQLAANGVWQYLLVI